MSGQTIYELAAGETTPWMDFKQWSGGGLCFQGSNVSAATADLETCNSNPTSELDTPADTITAETISDAEFSRTLYGPMALFGRIKNSAETGTVMVSFGTGYTSRGIVGNVSKIGFQAGTSGRSNEMPS